MNMQTTIFLPAAAAVEANGEWKWNYTSHSDGGVNDAIANRKWAFDEVDNFLCLDDG